MSMTMKQTEPTLALQPLMIAAAVLCLAGVAVSVELTRIHLLMQSEHALGERYRVQRAYVGHCTGARSLIALNQALGDKVQPCFAGLSLKF